MTIYDFMRKEIDERMQSWADKVMGGQLGPDMYRYMTGEIAGMRWAKELVNQAEQLDNSEQ